MAYTLVIIFSLLAVAATFYLADKAHQRDIAASLKRGATKVEPPKLVPIEGTKYAEMEDDTPPGIDWDEPIPDNVVYGNFQRPAEHCFQYRMSLRLTAAGVFALVVAWCLGSKELHVVSYYTADGTPLDASLNMQRDGAMDQRA